MANNEMTNEEKARELSDSRHCVGLTCEQCRDIVAIKMAQWKDEQFANERQALIEKMDSILDEAEKMRETAIGRHLTGGWYWRKWAEWGYRKAIEVMEETK